MAVSSLSRHQRLAAVGAAVALAVASWAYFTGLWRGVVLSGAGDPAANGYFKWEPTERAYIKSAARGGESGGPRRVPNVYDLVSRGPEFRKDAGPLYFLKANDNKQKQTRVWYVIRSKEPEYRNQHAVSVLDNTPPATGWEVGGSRKNGRGLGPPPDVRVCGKRVAPDLDNSTGPRANGRGPGKGESSLALGKGATEVINYPGTVFLLAVNLAFAYHLWAKRVSEAI